MNVRFFIEKGVEFISISGDFMGKDEVVREATDDDRRRYNGVYEEFKNPPAVVEPVAEASSSKPPLAPIDPHGKVS